MIRYAWRNIDPDYGKDGVDVPTLPEMVQSIQFDLAPRQRCEERNCSAHALIKCSHCGEHLCLKHFLERACFHEHDDSTDIHDEFDGETCSVGHQYWTRFSSSTTERPSGGASGLISSGIVSGIAIGTGTGVFGSGAASAGTISAGVAGAGASVADAAATSFTGPAKASSSPTKEEAGEEIPLLDTGHFRPVWVETKLPDVSYKDLIRDSNPAENTRNNVTTVEIDVSRKIRK